MENFENPSQNPPIEQPVPKPETTRRIEDVVPPALLEMMAEASGGFRFQADPSLPPGQTGYTNKENRTIYYNPLMFHGSEEHGLKPWRNEDVLGFTSHEAGHHAPAVLQFDRMLLKDLGNPDIIPPAYKGSPQAEQRFFNALFRHLDNGLIDIWLESYMGRTPYIPIRHAITEFQSAKGEWDDYRSVSKPQQLMQVMLRSRYINQTNLEQKLDPDVYAAFQKIQSSKAIQTLMDKRAHENYFATPTDRKREIEKKFQVYKQIFLPTYLELLENELEERKQQRQSSGGGDGRGSPGQGSPGSAEGVPLTKEEEEELVQQIIEELEKAGEEFASMAPSQEEAQEVAKKFSQIQQVLQQLHSKEQGEPTEQPPFEGEMEREHGLEELQRTMRQLMREQQIRQRESLANKFDVRPESIRRWEEIKERLHEQINSTAVALSEIFLDDRRKRMEYLVREGDVVPGLEFETVAAMISGDLDPDTKMRNVGNPEFMETEIEFIVDRSGSMGQQNKIDRTVEMIVVTVEAFKQAREVLDAESLLLEDEQPFRIGLTTFADAPERVTQLDDPLDDQKEVLIIDRALQTEGSTYERAAIEGVYQELKLRQNNVAKIIIVLTDGQGEESSVAPIMRQVEADDEVSFLVVGLGEDQEASEAIARTYLMPLIDREKNVFGIAAPDSADILPRVLAFLRQEVNKRRKF